MGAVVRALEEDNMEIIGCVTKKGCCCPSSALWKKLFEGINDILDGITLRDIADGTLEPIKEQCGAKKKCSRDPATKSCGNCGQTI